MYQPCILSRFHFLLLVFASLVAFGARCEPPDKVPDANEKVFIMASYLNRGFRPTQATNKFVGVDAIRQHIFGKYGYDYRLLPLPIKRMGLALKDGIIDGFSMHPSAQLTNRQFNTSLYPDFGYPVNIYYKKSEQWAPSWPARDDFLKASGVSKNYTDLQQLGLNLQQIREWDAGAQMVHAGRVDYWIDTIRNNNPLFELKFDDENYRLEQLYFSAMNLSFSESPRGKEFLRIWNEEFPKLLADEAEFRKIYTRNLPPNMKTVWLDDYYEYMRKTYPEIFAPSS